MSSHASHIPPSALVTLNPLSVSKDLPNLDICHTTCDPPCLAPSLSLTFQVHPCRSVGHAFFLLGAEYDPTVWVGHVAGPCTVRATWAVPAFWALWPGLPRTFMCECVFESCFHFFWVCALGLGLQGRVETV